MRYGPLGESGLAVSAIGLGCEHLGGTDWGRVDLDAAMGAVRTAWDEGITVFDTADVYGLGASETRLSQALGAARHDAVIVSKFGVRWSAPRDPSTRAATWKDSSPDYLRTAVEASLRRLRIERIPVYLVHWPDPAVPLAVTLHALEELRRQGKIGVFGVSNLWADALGEALHLGAQAVELPLNVIDRRTEQELPVCRENGAGVITYGTYAQGLLSGKYARGAHFGTDDRRHRLPHFGADAWDRNEKVLTELAESGRDDGRTSAQVALSWVLSHPDVSCALVGAKTSDQVRQATLSLELV